MRRRAPRHNDRAKSVDRRLNYDVRQGKDDPLNSGWNSDAKNLQYDGAVESFLQFRPFDSKLVCFPNQAAHYKVRRYCLRDNRSKRHARHVHLKDDNEDQIENYVDYARDGKVIKRPFRIALCAKKRTPEIKDKHGNTAGKVHGDISRAKPQNLAGSLHPNQELFRKDYPDNGKRRAPKNAQKDGVMRRLTEILSVAGSEIKRRERIGANRQPNKEIRYQIDERACRTDGGERMLAREISNDNHVGGVKEQLQNARRHERERRHKQLRQNCPRRHVDTVLISAVRHCRLLPPCGACPTQINPCQSIIFRRVIIPLIPIMSTTKITALYEIRRRRRFRFP